MPTPQLQVFFSFRSPYCYLASKPLFGTFVVGDQIFWGNDRLDFLGEHLSELGAEKQPPHCGNTGFAANAGLDC